MPSPRVARAAIEAAQKALTNSKGAARAVSEQLGLPLRSVAKGFAPGDVSARLQRAEAQGFDTANPLWHGTTREGFEMDSPQGIFLTPQKGSASSYADHAANKVYGGDEHNPMVLPFLMHKDARVYDATGLPGTKNGVIRDTEKFINAVAQARATPRGPKLGVSKLNPDDIGLRDVWGAFEVSDVYGDLGEIGFDSAKILDKDWEGTRHISQRILNPNSVRMAMADFDPRFAKALRSAKRIPNWLAGIPVAAGLSLSEE